SLTRISRLNRTMRPYVTAATVFFDSLIVPYLNSPVSPLTSGAGKSPARRKLCGLKSAKDLRAAIARYRGEARLYAGRSILLSALPRSRGKSLVECDLVSNRTL